MDDDWDEGESSPAPYQPTNTGFGKGKGRGYVNNLDGNADDNGGGFSNRSGGNFRGSRGGGRGGGGRGGRGGGRGRDHDNEHNGEGDRNGYQSRRNNRGDENGEPAEGGEKPREVYIPAEPSNDESVMFGSSISSGINFDKYDKIKIKVTGENIPTPIESFENSGLRPYLLDNIKKSGYTKPTPIQKHAIAIIREGRDIMACAQTGSGKTAAFLLPIIDVLLNKTTDIVMDGEHVEPQAIIVSPTRELTLQIFNEARKFAHGSIIKTCVAYGGTSLYYQANQVKNGCHILVATPGRLMDFVRRGRITFSSTRFFVLDEADRMLDMGFLGDIQKMLSHETMVSKSYRSSLKENRQTLMFSATFPEEIQLLASQFLNDYLFLAVGIVGGACSDVEQCFHQVPKYKKREKLNDLLKQEGGDRMLVFVETKRTADFIATFLSENDFPTTSIHGDRLQREREEALADFKSGRMKVLVATAVAARGLDIKNVSHVVNYDLPKTIDEYVHRIGRTGRVGNRGKASSFYDSEQDGALATSLVKILQQADQDVPEWLVSEGTGGSGGGYSANRFGGSDVRKFDSGFGSADNQNQPQAIEEEEEW